MLDFHASGTFTVASLLDHLDWMTPEVSQALGQMEPNHSVS